MLSAQDILARLAVVQGAMEDLECVAESFGQVRQPLEKVQRERKELEHEIFGCEQELLKEMQDRERLAKEYRNSKHRSSPVIWQT